MNAAMLHIYISLSRDSKTHATVDHDFFPLVRYGKPISHALKQRAIKEIKRAILNPASVVGERWFALRRELTTELREKAASPACQDRSVANYNAIYTTIGFSLATYCALLV